MLQGAGGAQKVSVQKLTPATLLPEPTPLEPMPHDPDVHVLHSSCTNHPNTIQLVCFISGFYPEPLTVEWLVNGQPGILRGHTASAKKDGDGRTFNTRSNASVSQDEWLEGKTYTCQVSHPGTGSTKQDHTPARPWGPLSLGCPMPGHPVFLVPPSPAALYVAQSPMLMCLVVNLPSNSSLQVVWSREKPGSVSPDRLDLAEQFNGTFTASSSMPILTRDSEVGETFTCKVEHSELPSSLIKSISKKVSPIPVPSREGCTLRGRPNPQQSEILALGPFASPCVMETSYPHPVLQDYQLPLRSPSIMEERGDVPTPTHIHTILLPTWPLLSDVHGSPV
uniref:Ig-like domain-containing protein n=1 Tax=Terrapene triunguis TaxID=2587831 RepID=A0A674IWB1_9SAUR